MEISWFHPSSSCMESHDLPRCVWVSSWPQLSGMKCPPGEYVLMAFSLCTIHTSHRLLCGLQIYGSTGQIEDAIGYHGNDYDGFVYSEQVIGKRLMSDMMKSGNKRRGKEGYFHSSSERKD